MRSEFLPLCRPAITEEDIAAVTAVLRSGWITTGPQAAALERAMADVTGAAHAVAVSSATAGMHVLLTALEIGPGDEVVTPSMTWVSTVNLITLTGAKPVFADVDRDNLMVSAETIAPCLSERTRLIVPVHFAGSAVQMAPIRALAAQVGAHVIEDAAHALGTELEGRPVGATGTTVFSFHPIKNITTGEGGMVCTDDAELAERIRRLKFHGLGVDAYDRRCQGRSPQAEVLEPGYKYNLPDLAAALGLGQLARLESLNRRRAELARLYRARLADVEEILPLKEVPWCTRHAWHLFVVRLDVDRARLSRDGFLEALKARNIGTGLHFRAVHLQKYYAEHGGGRGLLPQTEWNSDRLCSLPLFPGMTPEDVDDVVAAIKDVLSRSPVVTNPLANA